RCQLVAYQFPLRFKLLSVPFLSTFSSTFSRIDAALNPELVDSLVPPIRKQADAVAARLNFIEVRLHRCQRHVFVNILAHSESRLNAQSDFRNHSQCAKPDHYAVESLRIFFP